MLAIKDALRAAFADVDAADDQSALEGILGTQTLHVALDACYIALPHWHTAFTRHFLARWKELDSPMAPAPPPSFIIEPATRSIRNVIIGLCGAPGGGKTCSALRLATGLAHEREIVLIDTESGRSTEFASPAGTPLPEGPFNPAAPLFRFSVLHFPPPHSPYRYRAAIITAARRKPAVLIIDNISHEMHGIGGQLDMRDAAGPSDKFGWRAAKAAHLQMMQALMAYPWYVILTIRAKEKIKPAGAGGGIVNEGWLPQCDGSLPYDCTLLQLLDEGVPNGAAERPWKLPASLRHLIPLDRPFDEACGAALAKWCQPEGTWTDTST